VILGTPRGTRDYLPEECEKRRRVINDLRRVFESYGYGEVITPAFEHLELLEVKAGEEVKEQIYWFEDKAGRRLGLRFELTTPIARLIAQNPSLPKPLRFYYVLPVWRYEEPQRGRLREFWQAGVELVGVGEEWGDAEVIALLVNSLRRVGLAGFRVHVNDRRLIEGLLTGLGLGSDRMPTALRAIDKLERLGEEYVKNELKRQGLAEDAAEKLLEIVKSSTLEEVEASVGEKTFIEGLESLRRLFDELDSCYGLASFVTVDLRIVRGLDYYTGLVYEAKLESETGMGSVAGGGRYDDLISLVGGPPLPATGMAIGLERLIEALDLQGAPRVGKARRGVLVAPVSAEYRCHAVKVAEYLREGDASVVLEPGGRSLRSVLESADRRGFKYVVIIGEREVKTGLLTLRNLEEWKEQQVNVEEARRIVSS